jgi:hypothetical protein
MKTDDVLVCMRTGSAVNPPPGTTVGLCSQCQTPVRIAPSSQTLLLKNPRMKVLCHVCVMGVRVTNCFLVPGSIKEIITARARKAQDN